MEAPVRDGACRFYAGPKATTVLMRVGMICLCVVAAACASAGKGVRCAPIDPELYMDYGGLYDECTVQQRARMSNTPRIEYPYTPPRNLVCLIGTLRFVVDTLGKPIPQSVEVAAANDERYVEAMLNYLPQLRYAPGRVNNRPVHQIVRWESRTPVSALSAGRVDPTVRGSC